MTKQKEDSYTSELQHLDLNVTAFLVAAATLPQFVKHQQREFVMAIHCPGVFVFRSSITQRQPGVSNPF